MEGQERGGASSPRGWGELPADLCDLCVAIGRSFLLVGKCSLYIFIMLGRPYISPPDEILI